MRGKLLGSLVLAGCIACGLATAAAAQPSAYQTANMFQFGNPSNELAGAATLVRSEQAVVMRIATSGLDKKAAYTVWWIVFNNPDACSVPCNMDDLDNPDVGASVFYAAGFVTGTDGTGNVSARAEAGAPPEGTDVLLGTGLEPGNGFGAEIHLVVRSHGSIIPGSAAQQIGRFDPTCLVCSDQQAAVFAPVS